MTDLIDEAAEDLSAFGYQTTQLDKFDITCNKLFVESSGKARKLGFDKGHYFIFNAPKLSFLMQEHKEILQQQVVETLEFLLKENKLKRKDKILLVGIGNPDIMADSFGVFCVQNVGIEAFKKSNHIFKLLPNVFSNTGLNAYNIIRLVVEAFDMSGVILFDSLATTSLSRLGQSIQINDAGLTPGSAMNNFGLAINKQSLNVPCISIGVPMMICARELGQSENSILCEKDTKEKVYFLSDLVAYAVQKVLKG